MDAKIIVINPLSQLVSQKWVVLCLVFTEEGATGFRDELLSQEGNNFNIHIHEQRKALIQRKNPIRFPMFLTLESCFGLAWIVSPSTFQKTQWSRVNDTWEKIPFMWTHWQTYKTNSSGFPKQCDKEDCSPVLNLWTLAVGVRLITQPFRKLF